MQTLEMELLLDTYEAHSGAGGANAAGDDVRPVVKRITDLMNVDATTHAPPVLLFTWGTLTFTCVLARATQRFVMFRPDGTVRASVQVSFNDSRNGDIEPRRSRGDGLQQA